MPAKLDACVKKVMGDGHSESSAYAICTAALEGKAIAGMPAPYLMTLKEMMEQIPDDMPAMEGGDPVSSTMTIDTGSTMMIKAGRRISKANMEKLTAAMGIIKEVMGEMDAQPVGEAEDPEDSDGGEDIEETEEADTAPEGEPEEGDEEVPANEKEETPGVTIELEKKAIDPNALIFYGDAVKALGNGKVGGYLVRFSGPNDPDLYGDFFTKDTDFGQIDTCPVLYHHGYDPVMGLRSLGIGHTKKDAIGVWIESQLEMRDEYERAIYGMAEKGKLGWSSGTAPHLITKEQVGKAYHIKSWPLGLDASLTPIPAEPRNSAIPLKSLIPVGGETAADQTPTQSAKEADVMAIDESTKKEIMDMVSAAIKAALPQSGITQVIEAKKAPVEIKEPGSDHDGMKAMSRFLRTGEIPHDLRPDVGSKYYPGVENADGVKTTYNWSEGGTNDGYALVPPEFWNIIVQKRYEMSIFRGMGAQIMPTSSNKVMVPTEYTREAVFVKTTEVTGSSDQTTTEPVVQKEIDVFLYSRKIPISIQLLQDSAYPVEAFAADRFAHAAALTENNLFTVGSGNGATDPEGVFVGGTAGVTLASTSAIAQSEPMSLFYTLPSYYQAEAVWIMRNATLGKVRAITGNWFAYQPTPMGQPVKVPGNAGGTSGDLLYHPVWLTDYAAAVGSGAKSMIVGNPQFYGIAENQGMVIQRNPYDDAAHHMVNFYAYIRLGGAVLQAEAWQYATHPTA